MLKSAKNSKGNSAKSSKEPTFHYGLILRAYPSFQQMAMIEKNINAARFYYNFLVAQDNKLYRIGKEPAVTIPWLHNRREQILEETYGKTVQKQVVEKDGSVTIKNSRIGKLEYVKNTFPWLRDGALDSHMFDNVIVHHKDAWEMCKKGFMRKPTFHKKSYEGSYQTNCIYGKKDHARGISLFNGSVYFTEDKKHLALPKLGMVKVRYSPKLMARILKIKDVRIGTVTIRKTATGDYYVSLQMASKNQFVEKLPKCGEESIVGIDLNVKNFLTDSNNVVVNNPKYYRRMEKKLNYAKRRLGKRQARAKKEHRSLRTAKNYQKQRQKVARLSHKVFKQRKNFLHEVAKAYVKNHDVVVAEELRSKNLLKNHKLAKSLQDVGHRTFLTILEQKAEMYGKTFLTIDPAYTTQTCHCCGHVLKGKEKLTLNDREWTCPICGVHHDRDHNAALNILAKGIAQLGSVSRLKCAG